MSEMRQYLEAVCETVGCSSDGPDLALASRIQLRIIDLLGKEARIERLRSVLLRRFGATAKIETEMLRRASQGRGATPDELREWALKIGVPDDQKAEVRSCV